MLKHTCYSYPRTPKTYKYATIYVFTMWRICTHYFMVYNHTLILMEVKTVDKFYAKAYFMLYGNKALV